LLIFVSMLEIRLNHAMRNIAATIPMINII